MGVDHFAARLGHFVDHGLGRQTRGQLERMREIQADEMVIRRPGAGLGVSLHSADRQEALIGTGAQVVGLPMVGDRHHLVTGLAVLRQARGHVDVAVRSGRVDVKRRLVPVPLLLEWIGQG